MRYLADKRTSSYSFIDILEVSQYLELAERAYLDRGGLEGQRDPLKTTSAKRIRKRMIEDLIAGAVLPPIVIGLVLDEPSTSKLLNSSGEGSVIEAIPDEAKQTLAIIDGMQRTTALKEAMQENEDIKGSHIRVEFWVAKSVQSLIYRMLVLNSGQSPWKLSRQLSVVYASLLKATKDHVENIDVFSESDTRRRMQGGQYKSSTIAELYLSFSARNTSVDTKQEVSEQFARLDLIENLSKHQFQDYFYSVLQLLVNFDLVISRLPEIEFAVRFKKGRDLFGSAPARIGFIVAAGQYIIGRAGSERPEDEQDKRIEYLKKKFAGIVSKLKLMKDSDLEKYLSLDILSEVLDIKTGRVGDYERNVYEKAFSVLIEEENITSMETCWRAY